MNEAIKRAKQKVLTTWPTKTTSHTEDVVYRLSDMHRFMMSNVPDQAESSGPTEPVSTGKCSTAS